MKIRLLLLIVIAAMVLSACAVEPQQAIGGAEQVTVLGFDIPKNAAGHTTEQQNIIDRLKVTTDTTKVLWIHLISLDGKIIQRTPVAHKVTSSGKRLEPIKASENGPLIKGADGLTYRTDEFLLADGTYGSSDPYIYWFDPMHRYHQWGTAGGLGYLLTDYPIDLRNPQDLVNSMYNADKQAQEWQKLQEGQMCKKEGKSYNNETGECK